jgi:hypothetical protein
MAEPKSRTKAAPKAAVKRAGKSPDPAGAGAVFPHAQVAEAAYYLADKRGFAPGAEWEDWFSAEAQLGLRPEPGPEPLVEAPAAAQDGSAPKRAPRRARKAEGAAA